MAKEQIEMVVTSAKFNTRGVTMCTRLTEYNPELEKHGWKRVAVPLSFDPTERCIKSLAQDKRDYTIRMNKVVSSITFPTIRGDSATSVDGKLECKFRNHDITGKDLGDKYIDVFCGEHL